MLPLFFEFSFKNVIGHIKLHRDHADIIICQSPNVSVFALIKIDELTRKPEILATMRIMPFNKIFFVFGISLATDSYSSYFFFAGCRNIYIQDHMFVLSTGK